ncbi:MAG: HNH endonuclease, partial [Actinomycetota bacterium]
IQVLVDYQTLINGLHEHGIAETIDGVHLPVSAIRRMCCDANIIPTVLDGEGRVLDVGRAKRTATTEQRQALAAMHATCAHPNCNMPFNACRIHHLDWWTRDLGPTDLDNLVPLCEHHHHEVHEGGWGLTMTPDRVATWTRPDNTVYWTGSTIDRHQPAA